MVKVSRQAYFIGGGIASLAGAVYLIRDTGFDGENIHIYEALDILGGSNDGIGQPAMGFVTRGGRMLNKETYENFWDLFQSIPSLDRPERSVTEEIYRFTATHPTQAKARLIDRHGAILDAHSMGFDMKDRELLGKLLVTPEPELDNRTIKEWFADSPHFFTTNFWFMWQTTFAFQEWSSLFEFRRYMNRMMLEYSRIDTLAGVARTPYNQYDSLILPLKAFLEKRGVNMHLGCPVMDIDFARGDEEITVTAIHYKRNGEQDGTVLLRPEDLCFFTNGCITDCSSLGDMHTPAPWQPEHPPSAELWRKIAVKKAGLGNPKPFFDHVDETNWESFTVTLKGNTLLKMIEDYTGNVPGSGALMTFVDSNWRLSIVVAAQPHFRAQPMDQTIFWGYGLYTDREGNHVKKQMRDCTGKEILVELLHHLRFEREKDTIMDTVINVIPCMMPYVDALFQPHAYEDRPQVVPPGSTNFALISQFVEIPEDMVFTEEYSVRAARMAVYTLMKSNRKVIKVTPHHKNPLVLAKALYTTFR